MKETKQEQAKHRPRRALRDLLGMVSSKLQKAQFARHAVQIKNSGLGEPSATRLPAKLRTTGLNLTSAPRFGLCALEARVLEDACCASSTLDGGMLVRLKCNVHCVPPVCPRAFSMHVLILLKCARHAVVVC